MECIVCQKGPVASQSEYDSEVSINRERQLDPRADNRDINGPFNEPCIITYEIINTPKQIKRGRAKLCKNPVVELCGQRAQNRNPKQLSEDLKFLDKENIIALIRV